MIYKGRIGGVDRWGIDREAAELSRNPLEGDDDRIGCRGRGEQLVGLYVERRQYCGE